MYSVIIQQTTSNLNIISLILIKINQDHSNSFRRFWWSSCTDLQVQTQFFLYKFCSHQNTRHSLVLVNDLDSQSWLYEAQSWLYEAQSWSPWNQHYDPFHQDFYCYNMLPLGETDHNVGFTEINFGLRRANFGLRRANFDCLSR